MSFNWELINENESFVKTECETNNDSDAMEIIGEDFYYNRVMNLIGILIIDMFRN